MYLQQGLDSEPNSLREQIAAQFAGVNYSGFMPAPGSATHSVPKVAPHFRFDGCSGLPQQSLTKDLEGVRL